MSYSSRRMCAIGSDWIPSAMVGEQARLFLISEMSKSEDNSRFLLDCAGVDVLLIPVCTYFC